MIKYTSTPLFFLPWSARTNAPASKAKSPVAASRDKVTVSPENKDTVIVIKRDFYHFSD